MARRHAVEGLYDLLVDAGFRRALDDATHDDDDLQARFGELDPQVVAGALATQLLPHLTHALESLSGEGVERQVELANRVLGVLQAQALRAGLDDDDHLVTPPERLVALMRPARGLEASGAPARPTIPLTTSDLLVNGRRELRIGHELPRELASADRVDLLCAFVKFSGFRLVRDALAAFLTRRPGQLRVLTTTYMGATERRALDELRALGAEVRISYNHQTTRLHAKAWLMHRASGFSTAFIGSSNLSRAALLDGLEWNVRLSAVDNHAILQRFETTFAQYWEDAEFEPYDPVRFDEAARRERTHADADALVRAIDLRPYPHQREILDELDAERQAGHRRNLVVAATGTGKTVVAALDYRRLCERHGHLRLLFVAHRQEILQQSRATFRVAMRDPSLGEFCLGGLQPTHGDHVFATIQSLHADRLTGIAADAYDVVIIDEFHHAAADSYVRLLNHLDPRFLLGLTATPERADGGDVLGWFDQRVAAEIRLWEALDRSLLCPFQYLGIADETDLSAVTFRRGSYDRAELERVITGDQMRARRVLQAVAREIAAPHRMRALGFCVGRAHAELMAEAFVAAGLPAAAVAAQPLRRGGRVADVWMDRDDALRRLRDPRDPLCCVFCVDLFNEGVDVPEIDTVLFLRPTESATIFLQQLGRGLRHARHKSHLTVLDFIGNAHRRYRFDLKLRALTGGTRRELTEQVADDFPTLPPGCDIRLDRQSQQHILDNLRRALGHDVRGLADELARIAAVRGPQVTLDTFLREAMLDPDDLYSSPGRSWTDLRRRADLPWPAARDGESALLRAVGRLQHVDDRERLSHWRHWLRTDSPPALAPLDQREGRLQLMLLGAVVDSKLALSQREDAWRSLWTHAAVRRELVELFDALDDRLRRVGHDLFSSSTVAVRAHATYSLPEIMAGFGIIKKDALYAPREGVLWDPASATDLLFVTLQKSESEYSPDTLYRDYPISETRFHWESQHMTRETSPTGRRYIEHDPRGSHVVLFVRRARKVGSLTQPYLCLGRAHYESHTSERPMQVVWRLEHPMPPRFYQEAKLAAG